MARRPLTGRAAEDSRRAREVADKYFDLDSAATDPADADSRREHLDHGYPDGSRPARTKPKPPSKPAPKPEPELTDKQAQFVIEYCVDWNGTQAAIRAGFSAKSAARQAIELLHKPHVKRAIEEERKRRAAGAAWDAQRVFRRLGEELEADLLDIMDERGAFRPVRDWPLIWRQGGLLAGMKVRVEYDEDGNATGEVVEIKTPVRIRQVELVGKHIGMFRGDGGGEDPDGSPLAQLLGELQGTSIRPRTIEGTATVKPAVPQALPNSGGLKPRSGASG